MAKFDWGFEILNKDTAQKNRDSVIIQCTRTDTYAVFALGRNDDYEWGECIETTMSPARHNDAEDALNTWGWL